MRIFLHLSPPKSTLRFLVLVIIGISSFKPIQGADKSSETHSADGSLLNKPSEKSVRPGKPDSAISPAEVRKAPVGPATPVFIENKGQFDERVKFRVVGNGASIWLTKDGIVFDFLRATTPHPKASSPIGYKAAAADQESTRIVFAQKFVAGDSGGQIEAKDPIPGTYNYFIGSDASKWVTHVRAYREVVYHDVWRGIDVKLAANGRNLEQEFIVHPGADPASVRLAYSGIKKLDLAKNGSLQIHTEFGNLTETQPRLFQQVDGKRVAVKGRFSISGDSYAFDVDHRNKEVALVIDPTLLYSTFLGGNAGVSCGNPPFGGCGLSENATGIAVDRAGSAYVTGVTASPDFPVTTGALQTTFAPDCCSFVTKLNPLGDQIQYSTFIGGTNFSGATSNAIAVNALGEAYITGLAGTGYPITPNALEPIFNGGIFFTKLSAQGDALLYSTQIGRASIGLARGNAIAVDPAGKAYITGSVDNGYSLDVTPSAFQTSFPPQAAQVAFLSVVDPTQSGRAALFYSTYLGGIGADNALGVAIDAFGMAYVTGFANDPLFPVTPGAYQTTYAGGVDAFVVKMNPNASGSASLIYSTYLGAPNEDEGVGIGVDSLGNAYVVGFTNSGLNSPPFPTTPGALQTTYTGGGNSGFVTKLNPAGNQLVYSTYHGGFQGAPTSVAVDGLGNAYVAGLTSGNFPATPDAFQPVFRGGSIFRASDAFVSKFGPDGTLLYSTFLGGGGGDGANGIAVDQVGDAYVTGFTASLDFPSTISAFQRALKVGGGSPADAFITKLPLGSPGGLVITGILPPKAGNVGTATPEIVGSGFRSGAKVMLAGSGAKDIIAGRVSVGIDGRTMRPTFDLTNAPPGIRDLVITNGDGISVTSTKAFTIQQGGAADLRIQKLGTTPFKSVNGSANVQYVIAVQNLGNIDAMDTLVSEVFGFESALTSVHPDALGDLATSAVLSSILWASPLGPSETKTFAYGTTVSAPTGTPVLGGPACIFPLQFYLGALACTAAKCAATPECAEALLVCSHDPTDIDCPIDMGKCQTSLLTNGGACVGAYNSCLNNARNACSLVTGVVLGRSGDPNYLSGTSGIGTQRWISGVDNLIYAIHFQNEATATAPAAKIIVTVPIDANADLNSLSVAAINLPSSSVPIGAAFSPRIGLNELVESVDLRPTQHLVIQVGVKLDPAARLLSWILTSIDPDTGLPVPPGATGFLPPDAEGSVFFTVHPRENLSTGSQISHQGSVIFDNNASVPTLIWTNTIDNSPPVSHVTGLPANESSTTFTVEWSGTDVGAGVQDFSIFVSDNGGPFTPLEVNTTATSATFTGVLGHTYAFYSIARDLVGNVENAKASADTTTVVSTDAIPPTTVAVLSPSPNANGWNNSNVTATLTATDNPGGSGVQQITFIATGAQPIAATNAPGTSASALISTEGITNFSFFASDLAGNFEATHPLVIKLDKTPPSITGARTPVANANSWNITNVTVSFVCSDALSGLAAGSPPAPTVLTTEGANQQVTGTCQDLAGNAASATMSGINIDKTPPALSGLPAAGCTLWPPDKKFVTVATISAEDVLSGMSSLNVTGTSNEPEDPNDPEIIISGTGTQPRTVQLRADRLGTGTGRVYTLATTATDAAGNTTTDVSTCTVPHDQGN